MLHKLSKIFKKKTLTKEQKIEQYIKNGRIPWSFGYMEYKEKFIKDSIENEEVLKSFGNKTINSFGVNVDERCVEYPWIINKISHEKELMLDAGSTFNFEYILDNERLKNKELTIFTYYPENNCFYKKRISYIYGDLRNMYFHDNTFDLIVSQSTIEHIDMDNSMYGYSSDITHSEKSYEYLKAVSEMLRVLKPGGNLLLTFPFGKFENHGFFQQFDDEMLERLLNIMKDMGEILTDYFVYEKTGWKFSDRESLRNIQSFNPHTGKGKLDDGAAHCRSIVCIEFNKK